MKLEYTNKLNLTKDKSEKELPFNKIADNKSKYYKVEKSSTNIIKLLSIK